VRFCESNPQSILALLDEDDIRDRREQRRLERLASRILKLCSGDQDVARRVQEFSVVAGFASDTDMMDKLSTLLGDVLGTASAKSSSSASASISASSGIEAAVDRNICCFATGKLYTDALLGVGVSRERQNLGTSAELLSKEAFDGGLRQNTNKSQFEFFLPVWINEVHAAKSAKWQDTLKQSYQLIGRKVNQASDDDECIMQVFPRLINQMIVEVMKPEAAKSAAIATFEALCNFWRTFRWLVDTRKSLQKRIGTTLSKFVASEDFRHKDTTQDLGALLVLFTVAQGHEFCPSRREFTEAYFDENSVRWVMWWQRSGTSPQSAPVFNATQVSREICMFQLMVVDIVVADASETLRQIESTNCKLPERLEKLQAQWRQQKSAIKDWPSYFACIGVSLKHQNESMWIRDCVDRAANKGPKYGSGKGDGKGSKGNGKGWGRR